MNLDTYRTKLVTWVAVAIGMLAALAAGKLIGSGQFGTLGWISALGVYGVALLILRERIWILVLLSWPLMGRLQFLPVPFSPRDVAVLLGIVGSLVCIAFRLVKVRAKFSLLDALLWINIIWIAVTWIRNPVGVAAFDSSRVGGRPYFDTAIGVGAYWVLCRAVAGESLLKNIPRMVVGVVGVIFVINVILFYEPGLIGYVVPFYSGWEGIGIQTSWEVAPPMVDGMRYEFFRDIGRYMSVYLVAYYAPVSLLIPMYWGRFLATVATFTGLLLSGFRGFVIAFFGLFVLSSYFRGGFAPAARAIVAVLAGTCLLMLIHTVRPLPFAAQRALAFIPESVRPVKLSQAAVDDGTESTRWRVEIWKLALTTDRYIQDKWFGDGFGIEKWQFTVAAAIAARSGDYYAAQESMAIVGDFHSGPVSTIRVAGYIGLALFITLLGMLARKAAFLIRACRGTPLERPAFYFCLPIVFEPFWFIFVFGGFNMAPAWAAVSLGALKLLENSLEHWKASGGVPAPSPLPERANSRPDELSLANSGR